MVLQFPFTSLQHFLRGRMSLLLYPWLPYLLFIKCDTVSIQSALTCYELEVYQLLVSGTSLKWCDIIILWCPLLVLWSGLQTISHDLLVRNLNTHHLTGDSFETDSAAPGIVELQNIMNRWDEIANYCMSIFSEHASLQIESIWPIKSLYIIDFLSYHLLLSSSRCQGSILRSHLALCHQA